MIATIFDKNTIHIHDVKQFDTYAILHSGQVFRYWKTPEGWLVMSCDHWAEIIEHENQIEIKCDNADYFYQYFDLETDYQVITKTFHEPKLQKATYYGRGIRILRADFIETVLSFIISANNNIKRFTKTINDICEQYGTKTSSGYYSFPTLQQCCLIHEEDFKRLGCGYRSPYLVKAIQQLSNIDYNQLARLSNQEMQHELIKISGVGPKVCACIMLFAFHRLDIAPIDTWIKKAISQLSAQEQEKILHGQYSGIAQQYIFYYLQHLRREIL